MSIARLDERSARPTSGLTVAQRRLFEARSGRGEPPLPPKPARRTRRWSSAPALAIEIVRLEEAGAELEERRSHSRRARPDAPPPRPAPRGDRRGRSQLDADIRDLDALRDVVTATGEAVTALRGPRRRSRGLDQVEARGALDAIRAWCPSSTSPAPPRQADLSHLAHTCEDAVNATLDEVALEVDQLERDGHAVPDSTSYSRRTDEDASRQSRSVVSPSRQFGRLMTCDWRHGVSGRSISAEEAIAAQRARSSGSGRST